MGARLPSRLDFGIQIINIRQVTTKEMRELYECEEDDVTPDGFWDADSDSIYLLKKLSLSQKRLVLFHELVHAAVDNEYWARLEGLTK